MRKRFFPCSRRLESLLYICTILFAGTAFGQCPLRFDDSDQAIIGIYVAPIEGGEALVDYNSGTLMTPASVMKSVTAAAALSKYGGEYRWVTDVLAIGEVRDGVLHGNVIVEASGDPTLGSKAFRKEREDFLTAVANGANAAGISSVSGEVKIADTAWPDQGPVPSWELEDLDNIDGVGFFALNWRDNACRIKSKELPAAQLEAELKGVLKAAGQAIALQPDTIVLCRYYSPALKEVVHSLMVRSDNQMAEGVQRLLAPRATRGAAIKAERETLEALGANLLNVRIADGSGLSRHDAISPRQLGGVLRAMASNQDYVDSYARVGLDGTVKNFMKGVPGRQNFLLKSGSMTGVMCYAGYRLDPERKVPTHVIVVMVNNAPSATAARTATAAFLSSLRY